MKTIHHILAAAFTLALASEAKSMCGGNALSPPAGVFFENEPFARISFYRRVATNVQSLGDYFTVDGSARAGVHYIARSGTARFGVGETAINIDVPLIDNSLVDGAREFNIVINGEMFWIRIEDNEMQSTVDPLFVPDIARSGSSPLILADGRILIVDRRGTLRRLLTNGQLDLTFQATLDETFAGLGLLQVMHDGRILALQYPGNGATPAPPRLVRLFPDGTLDTFFTISNFAGFVSAQSDGKILLFQWTGHDASRILRRLNGDGSLDVGFVGVDGNISVVLQPDGKLLVLGSKLARLNPDSSLDSSFSSPVFPDPIYNFLYRGSGKLIVGYGTNVVQLDDDGSLDARFGLEGNGDRERELPALELPDGRLLARPRFVDWFSHSTATRWDKNGALDANFAPDIVGGDVVCDGYQASFVQGDQLFVTGSELHSVDGFPRRGLARLLTNPPERDFRVFTPAEFYRSSGVARVRVVRTGATTNTASVVFATRDDTAKAGEDYAPQSGTLNFAPLEVSKEVMVPLLAKTDLAARLSFKLELSNPSTGYTNIASTPIVILPDLRIATDSLLPRADGSITVRLNGTLSGRWYGLETSTDLKNWQWIAGTEAGGSTTVFAVSLPKTSPQFFRTRGE